MATWIVHLRVAESCLARIRGLDPALFAIGNIAPISGIAAALRLSPGRKWATLTTAAEKVYNIYHRLCIQGEQMEN